MSMTASTSNDRAGSETGFALAVVAILLVLFVPLPPILIDLGLALSMSLSVVILMVALWIRQPLEFSAFPTVLLIATLLRLALNIATTRVILTHGHTGPDAAGHVIAGFADFVMGGDFLIGSVVFVILITVNFLVITKGATRIAEVGARFSLDAMPGKQMAIDADLSAGSIDEVTANRRRRELEEESAFFGSMDGASKFVRGDAIAGLIITGVNIFGGVLIGMFRHGLSFEQALDAYTRLSIGDGLVTQIPALIVSLSAGLLVSKGGTRGPAEAAVIGQLSGFPQALIVSGALMTALSLAPGLPMLPFVTLGGGLLAIGTSLRRSESANADARVEQLTEGDGPKNMPVRIAPDPEIEIAFGRQLSASLLRGSDEIGVRVARMRRNFARQYGLVVPDIRLSDVPATGTRLYEIKLFGSLVAQGELRPGEVMVILGSEAAPDMPGEPTKDPAFGMPAMWYPEAFAHELRRLGYVPVDNLSILLTHLAEALRGNLAQLMTYKCLRGLLEQLEPEYRKLLDEIVPGHISHSNLLGVLRTLLSERVSVRNLSVVLEAVAEVANLTRKTDVISEHVRSRIAQQICGDLTQEGVLKVLRLSSNWELVFHQAVKRDTKGEVIDFSIDPKVIEQFGAQATPFIQKHLDEGAQFCIVCASGSRPFVRMIVERLFPSISVLSHAELVRGVPLHLLGVIP